MKYSIDTYRLYLKEKQFHYSMRLRVKMKDQVDPVVLRKSVNEAIERYPYFAVRIKLDEDGGFLLQKNDAEIAVLPVEGKTRELGSREVNGHLCFVEYEGQTMYFNISHSICGGKGVQPWVMTNVYQYVKNKYGIEPEAPGIRKPGEPLLEGEDREPTFEMLSDEEPIYQGQSKNPYMPYMDYINGMINPFLKDSCYRIYAFRKEDIVRFIKDNDASVVSLFAVLIGKMLDRVLPARHPVIGVKISHNPCEDIGIPNAHSDFLTAIYIDYEREQLKWDMEKLGTMTRGQILLQKDPSVSSCQLKKLFNFYEGIDRMKGLKEKMAYATKNNLSSGKEARKHTYMCNYSGRVDWGEVAEYIEDYVIIVEGNLICEVTSLNDRIFLMMPQVVRTDKYANALNALLRELSIPFSVSGPFEKRLPKHALPDA